VPPARALGQVTDAGLLDVVEELRVLEAAAREGVVTDVEHVGGVGAGAGREVGVAQDDAHVVASGRHTRRDGAFEWFHTDEAGRGRIAQRHLDDVDPVAAARHVVVEDQPVVGQVGGHARGVRAALGLHRRDQVRIAEVADVEHVQAFEPHRHGVAVAGPPGGGRRVPRAHQDVPVDDHVALVAEALLEQELARVGRRRDIHDPEPVVVPLERQVAPEGEIGVRRERAHRVGEERVAERMLFWLWSNVLAACIGRAFAATGRARTRARTSASARDDRRLIMEPPCRRPG